MKNLISKIKSMRFCFAGAVSGVLLEKSAFETVLDYYLATFKDFFAPLLRALMSLFLIVFEWIFTVIDFCFILIRQLCGMNTDFSSLDSVVENDIIFQFIFDERVTEITRNLFFLAIAVILIFGIIAIIRSEFAAVADNKSTGEIKNDKMGIWKNIFESLLLLITVPIITFGSIIMSNALLQTLYNYTAGSNNLSIGSQIFVASSYDANAFRRYVVQNQKIPITYSFDQIKDYSAISDWDESGTVAEIADVLSDYKNAEEWKQGYITFEMFYLETFFDLKIVDYYQQNDSNNAYNVAYDRGIKSYRYEYLVNADVVDFAMKHGQTIYYLTAQEAYESCLNAGIRLNMTATTNSNNEVVSDVVFNVNYNDESQPISYIHKLDATDEANGAVYLICLQKSKEVNGSTVYYYEPLTVSNSNLYTTNLYDENQYVVAKGIFDAGKYPTAIKKVNGKVTFYRDRLNVPTYSSFFPHISYELPAGSSEEPVTYVIKKGIELFTGIDPSEFIPYVYFDIDFLNLYNKSNVDVATLQNSGYYLDYRFSSKGTDVDFIYNKLHINVVIMFIATGVILGKMVGAIFGVIRRSVDIMFLYLIYPAAVATIPLYDKSSFGNWVKQMSQKILGLIGLMMGLNLALIMIPISTEIYLFTPEMISETFLKLLPRTFTVGALNYITQLLFLLVGIDFIFTATKTIQGLWEGAKKRDEATDIVSDGQSVVKGVTEVYKKTAKGLADIVTGKVIVDSVKNFTGYKDKEGNYHAGWIPGSAIIGKAQEVREHQINKKKANNMDLEIDQNKQNMKNAIRDAKNNGGGGKGK